MVLVWWSNAMLAIVPPHESEREYVVSSSTARIEHRSVPLPRSRVAPAQQPVHVAEQRPRVQRRPVTKPHEIAHIVRNAPPEPHPQRSANPTLAQQLAAQEEQFAREAQRLHAQNAPLSAATISPEAASAMRKQYYNLSGQYDREGVQAVLTPVKHWYDGDQSCYYVRYDAQFSGGGSEDGTIPWPVCYPRTADRMLPLDRTHALPIPYPPPGYTLPARAYVTPLLRGIYDKRPNPSGT